MRIGELAARAGTTTRALRYYESRGLLAAQRDANGHRTYAEDDLRLLQQIRTLQDFGFELEETRPFAECLRAGNSAGDVCPAARDVYRRKLAELEDCIAQLQSVRDEVRARLAAAEAQVSGAAQGEADAEPASGTGLKSLPGLRLASAPGCGTNCHGKHQNHQSD